MELVSHENSHHFTFGRQLYQERLVCPEIISPSDERAGYAAPQS